MFEGIKKFFQKKNEVVEESSFEVDGLKVMTIEEIVEDHDAFQNMDMVVRYLYTKDKERDTTRQIGFIGKELEK